MSVEVRFATSEAEKDAIYAFRYDIYVDEMGYRFPNLNASQRRLGDADSRPSQLLYATRQGEIVGTLRINCGADAPFTDEELTVYRIGQFAPVVPVDRMAIFSRFMSRPDDRSGSVPRLLLSTMMEFLAERRVQLLFCDCRPHLIGLYERLGFRAYGDVLSDPVAGVLTTLVLVFDDREYLKRIKSPMLPLLERYPSDPGTAARLAPLCPPPAAHVLQNPHEWPDVLVSVGGEGSGPIFEGLSESQLTPLLEGSHVIQVKAGDVILREEQGERSIFMVLDGEVQVSHGQYQVATIGKGDIFGEIAFLLNTPRTADVVALSPSVAVLCLRTSHLMDLIESGSPAAARLLLNLSRILASRVAARHGERI